MGAMGILKLFKNRTRGKYTPFNQHIISVCCQHMSEYGAFGEIIDSEGRNVTRHLIGSALSWFELCCRNTYIYFFMVFALLNESYFRA